jgi:hypothetical protein
MKAGELAVAIDAQDETLSIGLPFEDRVRLAVDDVYSSFTDSPVAGLSRQQNVVFQGFTGSHIWESRQKIEGGATDPQG